MPHREWKFRVQDILNCIGKIERHTKGMTFNDFEEDDKTIDAVLRNLEIIGEAARHIPGEVKSAHPEVPWVEMQAMRNIVVHEYHGVNLKIIWQTVKENLHPLKPLLRKILNSEK